MNGVDFYIDTITLDHVSELLYKTDSISIKNRSQCWETYLRSLEDFSFAVLFAAHVDVLSLPSADGNRILDYLEIRPENDTLNFTATLGEYSRQMDRPRLKGNIEWLASRKGIGEKYWTDFVKRELLIYKGDPKALIDPDFDFHGYHFGHNRGYLEDEELQKCFSADLVDKMYKAVREAQPSLGMTQEFIQNYFPRTLLTHTSIFHTHSQLLVELRPEALYLPHVTRAGLRLNELHVLSKETTLASYLRSIVHFLVPHALGAVLIDCNSREPEIFLTWLKTKRNTELFKEIRGLLGNAVLAALEGEYKDIKILLTDISKMSEKARLPMEKFTTNVTLGPGVSIKEETSAPLFEWMLEPQKHMLRQIIASATDSQYKEKLCEQFEEFRPLCEKA